MKRKELIKAVRAAKAVYAFSPITRHDGAYLKVEKQFLLDLLRGNADEIADYSAELRGNSLYLS